MSTTSSASEFKKQMLNKNGTLERIPKSQDPLHIISGTNAEHPFLKLEPVPKF